jgi:ABC-type nitrate/sulfonate/bicarbonate transport system substrate-binding protein
MKDLQRGAGGLIAAFILAVTAVPAGAQTPLPAVTFAIIAPNASEWPVFIAKQQGFFRDEGVDVTIVTAATPPNVMNELATGAAQMADTGSDTAIAGIARGLGVKIVAPLFTTNPFVLVVTPAIKSWADLKGGTVVLATKSDVTAISFARMAAKNKLAMSDFSIVVAGNSSERFAALAGGSVAGAMLSQPFDFEAEANGMHVLDTSYDTLPDWVFKTVDVNAAWAAANRTTAVKVLRALRRAITFGYAQRDATVAILVDATHASLPIAQRTYDEDFGRWKAFDPTLKLNENALLTVTNAQVEFGALQSAPTIAELYDGSYAAAALH